MTVTATGDELKITFLVSEGADWERGKTAFGFAGHVCDFPEYGNFVVDGKTVPWQQVDEKKPQQLSAVYTVSITGKQQGECTVWVYADQQTGEKTGIVQKYTINWKRAPDGVTASIALDKTDASGSLPRPPNWKPTSHP